MSRKHSFKESPAVALIMLGTAVQEGHISVVSDATMYAFYLGRKHPIAQAAQVSQASANNENSENSAKKRQIVTTLHTCSEMTYERYLFPEDMETLSGRILLGLYSCVQNFDSVRIIPSSDSQQSQRQQSQQIQRSQRSQRSKRRMFTVMPRIEVHVWHSDSYRNKRVDLYFVDPGSNPVDVKLLTSTTWNELTIQDFNRS